jgi:NAD(P)-dependent dehydrogenase (short-subunit alcohol dehydrogenase family)
MTTAAPVSSTQREPQLLGQTVVLIGGSAGIGLETARAARGEGADVVLVGRDPERLEHAAAEVDARSTAAFDATDPERLARFFAEAPGPIDHVLITAGGNYYARLADLDFTQARSLIDEHLLLPLYLARAAIGKVRPGGTLLFMGGTGGRRPGLGLALPGDLPPRGRRSSPTSRWNSRRFGSTSSPPASSTRRCRPGCSATTSTGAASICARRCRSGASSGRPTSPRWPSTS